MLWLIVLLVVCASPAFCEEKHVVRVVFEAQSDRQWGEFQDNVVRIRETHIPDPDGDIWLTDFFWSGLDFRPGLPKFKDPHPVPMIGIHVRAVEDPAYDRGLIGHCPKQDIYLSLRWDGRILGRGELIALTHWSLGAGDGPRYGAEVDDFQYPIFGDLIYAKARASWWQGQDLDYQYGASIHLDRLRLQAYYLFGTSQTWGVRWTLPLAGIDF